MPTDVRLDNKREPFPAGYLSWGSLSGRTKVARKCDVCQKPYEHAARLTCGDHECWKAWKRSYQRKFKAKRRPARHCACGKELWGRGPRVTCGSAECQRARVRERRRTDVL